MSGIIICCANCMRDYEPTHADILAGIRHWRLCPACRPATRPEPLPENETSEGADAA